MTLLALLVGCAKDQPVEKPQYSRPLPPGASALERLPDGWSVLDPALVAGQLHDARLREALDRSVKWFAIPSTTRYYPMGPVTHDHAKSSTQRFREIADLPDPASRASALIAEFDVWRSVGWNGQGDVLYTGYYAPVFTASATPTGPYRYPLYRRPDDLRTDDRGRVIGGYPTRAELESSGKLDGLELVYLPSRLDAYLIEVNGSAKLHMLDRSTLYIGYAGTNGHAYTSIGRALVADGKLDPDRLSLSALRRYFERHPRELDSYIRRNDRFVFFKPYDGGSWPAGSLGFRVTPQRSLATDKDVFPPGCPVVVDIDGSGGPPQVMVDQDTGGAIRAAGRADVYFGIGPDAEARAGRLATEGKLYYLLLKR